MTFPENTFALALAAIKQARIALDDVAETKDVLAAKLALDSALIDLINAKQRSSS